MSLPITNNARQASEKNEVKPGMILKFDRSGLLFGSAGIYEYIRIGMDDLFIGDDWVIGGYRLIGEQSPYITFNTGTTSKISQKLDPSRGKGTNVPGMVISLVDKNEEISKLMSPGFILSDPLGEPVTIYTGFTDTSWPHDYSIVMKGVVQNYQCGSGYVNLIINSSEDKKRLAVLPKTTTKLSSVLNYRSVQIQDIFYKNRIDVTNLVTVEYIGGQAPGTEYVNVIGGYNIKVYIQTLGTSASKIKELIENHINANQLVEMRIEGSSSNFQIPVGVTNLGTDTTINVYSTEYFKTPQDTVRTYLKIGDELIEYTGKTSTQFTGCVRASNNSTGSNYEIDDDIEQVLRIQDNPIDMALKIMLSGADTYYVEDLAAKTINYIHPTLTIPNAIIFECYDVAQEYGFTVGDKIDIYDALPANNMTDVTILEVNTVDTNSYIVLDATLTDESITTAKIRAKCRFNTLGFGLGMLPNEVDINQHITVRDRYLAGQQMDLFFNDEGDGKEFIENELYLPKACFSVPRKGRASVVHHAGPFPDYEIITLDSNNVLNPNQLKIERSTSENFFNQVNFDYNYDPVKEKYLSSEIKNAITTVQSKSKVFKIQSRGLRDSVAAQDQINQASEKLLKRYSVGAEFIKGVKVKMGVAYRSEIGDTVNVNYKSLQLTDIKSGSRAGDVRVMEIQNKILDNKTGEITIDLVNTIYSPDDRFGTISPSSLVGVGSTTSKAILQKSWSTQPWQKESSKYDDYIGQNIIIHSPDWNQVYDSKILGFDNNDPQGMSIQPISVAPQEGWIIQCPAYPFTENSSDEIYWKTRHAFMCNQAMVVAAPNPNEIELAPSDIAFCRVGMRIRIHNYSYSDDSGELTIDGITGNVLTLSGNLSFSAVGYFADILGFIDGGFAYRVV